TGGALGHASDLATATLVPLDDTIATCPVDYAKRAGELIARGARSLRSTWRQKRSAPPRELNGPGDEARGGHVVASHQVSLEHAASLLEQNADVRRQVGAQEHGSHASPDRPWLCGGQRPRRLHRLQRRICRGPHL